MFLSLIGTTSTLLVAYLSYIYLSPPPPKRISSKNGQPLASLIIPCMTQHKRYLPIPSSHSFSYPLVYLGLDLDELEGRFLDSTVFKYNSKAWKGILTLSREPYLSQPKTKNYSSLREELVDLVGSHGVDKGQIGKVWVITMPTYLGLTGINPLTVWYLYDNGEKGEDVIGRSASQISSDEEWVKTDFEASNAESVDEVGEKLASKSTGTTEPRVKPKLLCVVLEVHNTFGERHTYVLRVDHDEVPRTDVASGLNHAWIFPRTFHVSPFNNRQGYYRLDIADPFRIDGAKPVVRVTLSVLTKSKKRKLYAVLANNPSASRPAVEITPRNVLKAILWRQPLDLLLTTPRILRQAWTLHYEKKLSVYPRPELELRDAEVEIDRPWNETEEDEGGVGKSIGWKTSGMGEKAAGGLVKHYLELQSKILCKSVRICFDNPGVKTLEIGHVSAEKGQQPDLLIRTRHPAFFTQLLMAPTPEHFVLSAKVDHHTAISSPELFRQIFAGPADLPQMSHINASLFTAGTAIRRMYLIFLSSFSKRPIPPYLVVYLPLHWSAIANYSTFQLLLANCIMLAAYYADKVEEWIMYRMDARFVKGQAPWEGMVRIVNDTSGWRTETEKEIAMNDEFGSVFSW